MSDNELYEVCNVSEVVGLLPERSDVFVDSTDRYGVALSISKDTSPLEPTFLLMKDQKDINGSVVPENVAAVIKVQKTSEGPELHIEGGHASAPSHLLGELVCAVIGQIDRQPADIVAEVDNDTLTGFQIDEIRRLGIGALHFTHPEALIAKPPVSQVNPLSRFYGRDTLRQAA